MNHLLNVLHLKNEVMTQLDITCISSSTHHRAVFSPFSDNSDTSVVIITCILVSLQSRRQTKLAKLIINIRVMHFLNLINFRLSSCCLNIYTSITVFIFINIFNRIYIFQLCIMLKLFKRLKTRKQPK